MSTADYSVRAAEPADLPAAARLGAALVRFHHELDPQRFAILAEPLEPGYARFLASRLADDAAVVFVAETAQVRGAGGPAPHGGAAHQPEIIAYAYAELEPRNWADLLDAHARLHDIIVDPLWRGTGVGSALLAAVLEELRRRGAPRVVLATAWDNARARAAFARAGFRPTMVEMTRELEKQA